MSAILAVFNRDSRPVDRDIAIAMLECTSYHAIDGQELWLQENVALGFQAFWTTPEAVGELQPLHDAGDLHHLLFDGRIDNRRELIDSLNLHLADARTLSDAALALIGYRHWGDDLFRRILGPFVCVIYDAAAQKLICARDALGDRTLYYYSDATLFAAAVEPSALLVHPHVPDTLDDTTLALYYSVKIPLEGSTFYSAVQELTPATVLTVSQTESTRRKYWSLEPETLLILKDDAAYAERFRELLTASVRSRMRMTGTPAAMMSGGLDSSFVAALAASISAEKGQRLKTFSWIFDELRECDERDNIELICRELAVDATSIVSDDTWPFNYMHQIPYSTSAPVLNMYRILKDRIFVSASQQGARTLLVGVHADQMYADRFDWLGDLVVHGKSVAALSGLVAEIGHHHWRLTQSLALRRVVRRALTVTIPFTKTAGRIEKPAFWLTENAKALVEQSGALNQRRESGRSSRIDAMAGNRSAFGFSHEIPNGIRRGVEIRDPFRDRRMVEFMVTVPASQLWRSGQSKYIQRQAMAGIVPDRVRLSKRIGLLVPLWQRGMRRMNRGRLDGILQRDEVLWPSYVDRMWVQSAMRSEAMNRMGGAESLVLWHCVMGELWYSIGKGNAHVICPV